MIFWTWKEYSMGSDQKTKNTANHQGLHTVVYSYRLGKRSSRQKLKEQASMCDHTPIYPEFLSDSTEHELGKGTCKFKCNDETYEVDGTAVLQLYPFSRVSFRADLQSKLSDVELSKIRWIEFLGNEVTDFSFNNLKIDGFLGGLSKDWELRWHPRTEPIIGSGDETTQIKTVKFHLFDFPDFLSVKRGEAEKRYGERRRINAMKLECPDFSVSIKSPFESKEIQQDPKKERKPRMTHVGVLTRPDGSAFTGADAEKYLRQLGELLAFAKGKHSVPVCAGGYDAQEAKVWDCWSSPRLEFDWTDSWLDRHHPECLEILFPLFIEKMNNEIWQKPLHEAVYWYLKANNSFNGIDSGIILIQAALECLSFTFLVNAREMISSEGYKKLRASDKLKLLFRTLNIPISIPDECEDIHNLVASSSNIKWENFPHAFTEIRNSLVHPEKKNRDHMTKVYYDAWKCGLWCLEMVILGICEYNGKYSNRLKERWVGTVESVPWA